MSPKVSVIIPIYNAENYLERCLESLKTQKFKNFEVLLIDDGSTDNSLEICKWVSKKDSRFIFFSKDNGGVSSARNLGIELSKGEYITFIDPDDWIDENFLSLLFDAVSRDCNISFSMCSFYLVDKKIRKINTNLASGIKNKDFIKHEIIEKMFDVPAPYYGIANVWNKMYRKVFLREIRFEESLHFAEDWWFNYTLLDKSLKIAIVDEVLYYYSITNNANSLSKKFNANRAFDLAYFFPKVISFINQYDIEIVKAANNELRQFVNELAFAKIKLNKSEYETYVLKLHSDSKINIFINQQNSLNGIYKLILNNFYNLKFLNFFISILAITISIKHNRRLKKFIKKFVS